MRKSTLRSALAFLASLKLTVVAMATLAMGVLLNFREIADLDILIAAPLIVLSINLLAALTINPRIRSNTPLLLFHIALLALLCLYLVDEEFSLQARVELSEGQDFDPAQVVFMRAGRWYQNSLSQISFSQGSVSVDYGPGRVRGNTRSNVVLTTGTGDAVQTIGDNVPLRVDHYKLYTTHNKGFSTLLEWSPRNGEPQKGTIHFPSYPRFEWKQRNFLELSPNRRLVLDLVVRNPPPEDEAWVLNNDFSEIHLSISDDQGQYLLSPGEMVEIDGGNLSFDHTRMWMGYRIAYNPVLPWMFLIAVLAVGFLGWYFLVKFNAFSSRRSSEAIVFGIDHV